MSQLINVVLPCWRGDQDQAERLLKWIGELGMVQAPFWLLCDNTCNVNNLLHLARQSFSRVEWLEDRERITSNWNEVGDHPKSAAGPNSLFRQAAWHFYGIKQGPWLFMEPDAIPTKREWYEIICREYEVGQKPFMGYHVTPQNHPGVPNHLSGVAVYHQETPVLAPSAVFLGEVAFDISGVSDTCNPQKAHFTPIIFHQYRAPEFKTREEFEARVPHHVALYHACKSGTIIPFLRERLGIKQKEGDEISLCLPEKSSQQPLKSLASNGAGSSLAPHAPTVWEFRNGQLQEVA